MPLKNPLTSRALPGKKHLFLRAISLFLAAAFCAQDLALADGNITGPQPLLPLNVLSFEAPLQYCDLQESHFVPGAPLIVHIQDPHSNSSGQENIAEILRYLCAKYKLTDVFVEGGDQSGNLEALKEIASPAITKRVAKSLLLEGKIHGEEYLNLVSDTPIRIQGIESMDLYHKSLAEYSALASVRDAALEKLHAHQVAIAILKSELYPPQLLEYEKIDSSSHLERFLSLASQVGAQETVSAENIRKVRSLHESEKRIDFEKARLELFALSEQTSGLSEQQMRQYPQAAAYCEYQRLFSSLELGSLDREARQLEQKLYASLLETPDARLLREIDQYTGYLSSGYRLQMGSEEYRAFSQKKDSFSTLPVEAFLNRRLAENGRFQDLIEHDPVLEKAADAIQRFYGSVDERDLAFIQNLSSGFKGGACVLIAGGYHTEHLKEIFKKENYSYIVLSPRVSRETNQQKYENLLLNASTLRYSQAASRPIDVAGPLASASGLVLSDLKVRSALRKLGARLASFEKIHDDEMPVSILALTEAFTGDPSKMAKEIKGHLPNLEGFQAEHAQIEGLDVLFYPRINSQNKVWAFKKKDLEKIGTFFELRRRRELPDLDPQAFIAVSPAISKHFIGNGRELSIAMHAKLGDPTESVETHKDHSGVRFELNRTGIHEVWVFRVQDSQKVADSFGFKLRNPAVQRSREAAAADEIVVSGKELFDVFRGDTSANAKKINEALGDPRESLENEKRIEGIRFYLRKQKGYIVWVFNSQDKEAVALHFGFELRTAAVRRDAPRLSENETAASHQSMSHLFIGGKKASLKLLIKALGEPTLSETNEKIYKEIQFFLRRRGGGEVVWAFRSADKTRLAAILGLKLRQKEPRKDLEQALDDEIVVSSPGLSPVFVGKTDALPKKINTALGDPSVASEDTKKYGDVIFYLRKANTRTVWAFKEQDKEKVAILFNVLVRYNLEEIHADEISLSESSGDAEDLIRGGSKAVLKAKTGIFPEDPKLSKKETTVLSKAAASVTLYRRIYLGVPVWAFKVQDAAQAAVIFAAKGEVRVIGSRLSDLPSVRLERFSGAQQALISLLAEASAERDGFKDGSRVIAVQQGARFAVLTLSSQQKGGVRVGLAQHSLTLHRSAIRRAKARIARRQTEKVAISQAILRNQKQSEELSIRSLQKIAAQLQVERRVTVSIAVSGLDTWSIHRQIERIKKETADYARLKISFEFIDDQGRRLESYGLLVSDPQIEDAAKVFTGIPRQALLNQACHAHAAVLFMENHRHKMAPYGPSLRAAIASTLSSGLSQDLKLMLEALMAASINEQNAVYIQSPYKLKAPRLKDYRREKLLVRVSVLVDRQIYRTILNLQAHALAA